jgi:rSAM/selenodomain-associated transferase 1
MNLNNKINLNSDSPKSKNALIIFTRNPELGKCKTRLAKSIGDVAALNIYKYLLEHTATISQDVNADKFVFYSENIIKNDFWNDDVFNKKLQIGSDLGERMENAFKNMFQSHYEKVIIIGSDLLDLKTEYIETAFQLLQKNDFVIGPAKDGGYYLLGMKNLVPTLFKNKNWGTSTVLNDTLKDIQNSTFVLLKSLNDIDVFDDITSYQQLKKFL